MYDCCRCSHQNLTSASKCVNCDHDSGDEAQCTCYFYGTFPFQGSEWSSKQRITERTEWKKLVSSPGPVEFLGTRSVLYIRNVFQDNEECPQNAAPHDQPEKVTDFLGDDWNVLDGGTTKTEQLAKAALAECEALLPLCVVEEDRAAQTEKRTTEILQQLQKQINGFNWARRQKQLRCRRFRRLFAFIRRLRPRRRWPVRFRPKTGSSAGSEKTLTRSSIQSFATSSSSAILVEEQLVEDVWTHYARAMGWLLAQE